VDPALTLIQDRVMTDFLRDPALPAPPDLSMVTPSLLAKEPDRLLGQDEALDQGMGDIRTVRRTTTDPVLRVKAQRPSQPRKAAPVS
jgi:hypothetical protein